jgi:DNA-directed RNA polymerase subunit beta'
MISRFKSAKVDRVIVRTPLKCELPKGMCARCYGVTDSGAPIAKGTNIGLIAGTAIGERGTQLSMRVFHTGGVAGGGGGGVVGGIDRVSQLVKMPEILANSATLSPVAGEVKSVIESPIGGYDVTIGTQEAYIPGNLKVLVKKGSKVRRGQPLSGGVINPHDLLQATNIETVQRYIADEIHKVYANEGIKKRNVEVVTKALTNLGKIVDPGSSDEFIRGDYASLSRVASLNKKLKDPIQIFPVLRGVETLPLDQTTDWLARLQYRKLKETFIRAANEGWESDIHGLHPAPGLAYSAEFGRKDKTVGGPY